MTEVSGDGRRGVASRGAGPGRWSEAELKASGGVDDRASGLDAAVTPRRP